MVYSFIILLSIFLYTYVGYIFLIYILGSVLKSKHKIDEAYQPYITLIIPCLNEEMTIAKKIKNSLDIDYPKDKLEIIIIDSSSTDRTAETVKSFEKDGVKLITVPHNGKAFAMKYATDNICNGEIIISSDANAFFEKDTIRKVVRNFADKKIGGLTGAMRQIDQSGTNESKGGDLYWKIEKIMRIYESNFYSVISMSGEISCFRKDLVKQKEWYTKGCPDDFNLSLFIVNIGYRVIYEKEAFVYEKAPDVAVDVEKQKTRIIVQTITSILLNLKFMFKGRYGIIFFSHKILPLISPFLMIGIFITNLFLIDILIGKLIIITQIILYLAYIFKINFSIFKISNFFIFLNYLILKSWFMYFKGIDFTKRDKINSSRVGINIRTPEKIKLETEEKKSNI